MEIAHSLQVTGEPVNLTGTAPAGITISFTPASPVMLSPNKPTNVTIDLLAASSAAIGTDAITVKGVSGANSQTASFNLKVVQYLVAAAGNAFSPKVMNVTAGSTVYWQNYDGASAQCGPGPAGNGGQHNIVFTTLTGANSPTLNQFDIYHLTFNTTGSYFYYSGIDTDHLMNGTINVLATGGAGGMGMASRLPTFSLFKDGSSALEVPPGGIAATAAGVSAGGETALAPTAARGLGFGDLVFPNVHSSPLSGLGLGAAISLLLSLATLGAALAVSKTGKREFAALGAKRLLRPLPSGTGT
ncbi:MAG TPA: hypothetical protein VGS04_08040 [Nitrososphaerales archaeon]|nr:hypothetical protein [Nitrososphaerales archaeon]